MEEKDLLKTVARLSKKRPRPEPGTEEDQAEGSGTIP
jgi:hypothetical protein